MAIKNVLVAYTGAESSMGALRHAIRIARHHDAWLTGVLGHGRSPIERNRAEHLPDGLLRSLREHDRRQIDRARAAFDAAVEAQGWADKASFVDLDTEQGASVADFARTFDLVVTGMEVRRSAQEHLIAPPDAIALQSGRPVLVVPEGFDAPGLAEDMLLAWDGKRAAARAVGDALHLFRERGRVTVLTIGSEPAPGTDQLVENLCHHGVTCEHIHKPRERSVARTILDTARAAGAGVVIMGAFEHSKFSHDLWGGVTTDVMREANVPVFMSH